MPQTEFIQNQLIRRRVLFGKSRKKFRKKPPVMLHPLNIEREYYRRLIELVNVIAEQTEKIIIPNIQSLIDEYNFTLGKFDAAIIDGWSENADRMVSTLSLNIIANNPILQPDLMTLDIGQRTSAWNDTQWRKVMKSVVGVEFYQREPWLNDLLKSFSSENTSLIKSIPSQYLSELEGTLQRGIKSGERSETIAKEIRRKYEIRKTEPTKAAKSGYRTVNLRARSKLIARDQVSKLNGQLTKNRQEGLGIEKYTWRTSLDERVRKSHADREGEVYSWNNPPDDGHPGEPIQCRCYSEPVFTEELLNI